MASTFKYFQTILIVQLFYAFSMTLLAYALSGYGGIDALTLTDFNAAATNVSDIAGQIETATQRQVSVPIIDLAALVFYSGNIILDLMMNFFFAVPSMVTLIASGFMMFFPLDPIIASNIKLVLYALVVIPYFMALLAFITNVRSQSQTVV